MTLKTIKSFCGVVACAALTLWLVGCSPLEIGRTVWGSSTRVLRARRADAVSATFSCTRTACFESVLALTVPPPDVEDESDHVPVVESILGEDSPGPELKRRRAERMKRNPELYPPEDGETADAVSTGKPDGGPTEPREPDLAEIEADPLKFFTSLTLFSRDPRQRYLILMGVPGAIDTTEVGVFFEQDGDNIRIDVTSLSSFARNVAAEIIFARLDEEFAPVAAGE